MTEPRLTPLVELLILRGGVDMRTVLDAGRQGLATGHLEQLVEAVEALDYDRTGVAFTCLTYLLVTDPEALLDERSIAAIERRGAVRAIRNLAAAVHNGAGDPEQKFYDHGVSPWLSAHADHLEHDTEGTHP